MQLRPIGRSGLSIAPLVLGTNVFGWNVDERTAFAILDAFVDAGFSAVDTADSYSRWVPGHAGGESETVIGNWLAASGKRDSIMLATKLGEDMGQGPGEGRSLKADYVIRAAEASLKRLKTDCIDLYQTHFDDETTPVEETLEAYARLIAAGKVRTIGASNLSPARIEASLAASQRLGLPRYECLQPLYNLSDRNEFESEYAPICAREGLGAIPYYALAAGFLTGKYRSAEEAAKHPGRGGRLKRYFDARGHRLLDALAAVAQRHGATQTQVSLAWMIAQPQVTAPIVSATSVAQLQDIMKAPSLALSADDLAALDAASRTAGSAR